MKSFDEYFGAVNFAAARINRKILEKAFETIDGCARLYITVSYTHLTLPTILRV